MTSSLCYRLMMSAVFCVHLQQLETTDFLSQGQKRASLLIFPLSKLYLFVVKANAFFLCVFACLAKCTLKAGCSSLLTTQCWDFCLVPIRREKDVLVCFAERTIASFFYYSTEVRGNNTSPKLDGLALVSR